MLLSLSLCGSLLFAYHTLCVWVLKNKAIATEVFQRIWEH